MARYTSTLLEYTGVIGLPADAYFDLELGQVPTRFQVGPTDQMAPGIVLFTQRYTSGTGQQDPGFANAAHLQQVLEGYLLSVGQTDYQVECLYYPEQPLDPDDPDSVFSPHTVRLRITARAFGSAYDFPPLVLSANFPAHTQRYVASMPPPEVEATVTERICFGSNTGNILLVPTGGVAPYTFAWSDGATTASRVGVPAGTYVLTRTHSAGPDPLDYANTYDQVPGVRVLTFTVGQYPRLDVLLRTVDDTAELLVSGGTAPYTYAWDDGPTTPTRTGLEAGVYTCTVTDAVGCTAQATVRVESNRYYFAGNPILLPLDAGDAYREDPASKPNLVFVCEVMVEREYLSGQFELVGTVLEQPADRDGRTTFEVQELLAAYLDFHVPDVGQSTISRADAGFRRFYLKYAELYGEPQVRSSTTTLALHYVVLGGLSSYAFAARTWFTDYQAQLRPFFSWQPNDRAVAADQPEFLYFMPFEPEMDTFQLWVAPRFSDGSRPARLVATQAGAQRYELYCLPAGYAQLGLADVAGKHLVGWDVWVSDENGSIRSEVRRYWLERKLPAQRRYLLYGNALGGMSTVALVGEAQLDVEVSGEDVERAMGTRPDPLQGDMQVLDRSLRPVLKLASGVREGSREWLAVAQDLLLARRVLLLSNGRWVPAVLKAKTVPIVKETETVQTLEVELQLPRERYYTPHLAPVPAGLSATPVTRQDLLLP